MKNLMFFYRKWRGRIRRIRRLLFMSPAEARFVELMGGHVVTFRKVRHWRTGFPLTIYWRLGKIMRREHFKREVRIGKYFVDFATDDGLVIEIDGQSYHMDILADLERESYINERGHIIMRIPAHRVYREPGRVQQDVLKLLYV